MVTRKLSIVVLAVAACFTGMGCRASEETSTEKSNPELMQYKEDDDSFRMRLLMVELVQKDLRLTDNQLEKLGGLYETGMAQVREIFPKLPEVDSSPQSLSEEEYKELMQKIKDLNRAKKKFQAKSFAILTPGQMERLKQIQLQATMPRSLKRPEIIKALHLSEEQLDKIRTLRDQMRQREFAKRSDRSNPDQEEWMIELLKALYKDQVETINRTLDILTPEQQTELEKLTGKKIDLTQIHNVWIQRGKSYFENQNGNGYGWPSPFAEKNEENSQTKPKQ